MNDVVPYCALMGFKCINYVVKHWTITLGGWDFFKRKGTFRKDTEFVIER